MLITIRGSEAVQPPGLPTFLAGAFRPMFLLGAIYAVIALLAWLGAWLGYFALPTRWIGWWWHGHEMLFGFVLAAVAGFIMTAAPKWTGSEAPRGKPLGLFVLAWSLARVAAWTSAWLPEELLAVTDLLVVVPLAIWAGLRIYGTKNRRNYVVPILLAAVAGADAAFHLQLLGVFVDARPLGLYLGAYLVVLVAVLISGRIVPAFTESALKISRGASDLRQRPRLSVAALVVAAVALVVELFVADDRIVAALAGLAAVLLAGRSMGWRFRQTLSAPIVWILHLGHAWLVVGFALLAISHATAWFTPAIALHAFTTGALGTLILAVTTRASLGHSGRSLDVSAAIVLAYVLVSVGAVLRVVAGVLGPDAGIAWMMISGLAWAGAFSIFAIVYWPILTKPRIDGRPG